MAEGNRSARGKSFNSDQDEAICNAYLCVSQDPIDPIVGTNQPRSKLWDRVAKKYTEFTGGDVRSDASIKSRWQIIQQACNKYRGHLRQIQRQHQSGMTEQNEIDLAKRHYKDTENKPFANLDCCWAILEHSMKWADLTPSRSDPRSSQMDTSSVPLSPDFSQNPNLDSPDFSQVPNTSTTLEDSNPTSGGSVQSPRKRPPGCKASKAKLLKTKKSGNEEREWINLMEKFNQTTSDKESRRAEMEARRVAALERTTTNDERRVALEERKAAIKEKEMEDGIMQMDLDLVQDPQMKAYYQYRKGEILVKWTASSSSNGYFPDFPDY
ncbi:uncharacterized protein LOC131328898 [Rhododendron vialii]|uniref:uncharacterized protein LOC131328898 n=1 Tax=Rhododendron vialii TaxID=182163 RepID=UPI00265E80D6|nr:uncharacterized protein LOC131328898 [Rhododendron vialii]